VTVQALLLIVGAYLLGSVPAAYIAARWFKKVDIRQYGTGNVGASNLMRLTSVWRVIPVVIFDLGKGVIVVWLARLLGMDVVVQVLAGLAAIIGHNWSVFLKFSGGRGVLTALGVVTALSPWLGLTSLVIAFSLAPWHHLSLGVLVVVTILPIFSWFLPHIFGIERPLPVTLGFVAVFLVVVIRRLTVPPSALATTATRKQLLVNRLLFDRDIRDRQTWLDRKQTEQERERASR
jgi:glycerol-3-phosphate acyltransferase PlsY